MLTPAQVFKAHYNRENRSLSIPGNVAFDAEKLAFSRQLLRLRELEINPSTSVLISLMKSPYLSNLRVLRVDGDSCEQATFIASQADLPALRKLVISGQYPDDEEFFALAVSPKFTSLQHISFDFYDGIPLYGIERLLQSPFLPSLLEVSGSDDRDDYDASELNKKRIRIVASPGFAIEDPNTEPIWWLLAYSLLQPEFQSQHREKVIQNALLFEKSATAKHHHGVAWRWIKAHILRWIGRDLDLAAEAFPSLRTEIESRQKKMSLFSSVYGDALFQ